MQTLRTNTPFLRGRLALALAAALTGPAAHASTVAEYFFNGSASYNATSGQLAVGSDATIFASSGLPQSLSVIPTGQAGANVVGSQVDLSVVLDPTSITDNGAQTSANFVPNTSQPLVQLFLGNGSGGTASAAVLTGTVTNVQLTGVDGLNAGVLTAYLHPSGGTAFGYFSDPSDVIALNFDLTTNFAASMYASSFSGQINGEVVSSAPTVPLPASGWLLAGGLATVLGLQRRRRVESRIS